MHLFLIIIIVLLHTFWIVHATFTGTKQAIEKNLRNECLEYQHTKDDQVVCIKRLSEEQINQILDR
jgi:hypothetical protein